MIILGVPFLVAIVAFLAVGSTVFFLTANAQVGFNFGVLASVAAAIGTAVAIKKMQDDGLAKHTNIKRVYNYSMEDTFAKLQIRMELAVVGSKSWRPKIIEMSQGIAVYTFERPTEVAGLVKLDQLSFMVLKARDVSTALDQPKTNVLIHFSNNTEMYHPEELIRLAKHVVAGLDSSMPDHQKLECTAEDVAEMMALGFAR